MEEDIKILKRIQQYEAIGPEYYLLDEERQAIENILNELERLQKENREQQKIINKRNEENVELSLICIKKDKQIQQLLGDE